VIQDCLPAEDSRSILGCRRCTTNLRERHGSLSVFRVSDSSHEKDETIPIHVIDKADKLWSKVRLCMRRNNPQPRQDPNVSLYLYFTSLALRLPLFASRLSQTLSAAKMEGTSSSNVTFIGVIISHQDGGPFKSVNPLVDSYLNMTEPMYGSLTHFSPIISPSPRRRSKRTKPPDAEIWVFLLNSDSSALDGRSRTRRCVVGSDI